MQEIVTEHPVVLIEPCIFMENEATCVVELSGHIQAYNLPIVTPRIWSHLTRPSYQTFMNISTVWPLLLRTTVCVIITFPIISEHSSILVPLVWVETNFTSTSKVGAHGDKGLGSFRGHLSTGAQLGQECGGIERPVDFQKLYNFKRYSSAGRLVRKGAILNPIPPTASNQSGLMCLYM